WTTDRKLRLTAARGAALAVLGLGPDALPAAPQPDDTAGSLDPLLAHALRLALAGEQVSCEQEREGRLFLLRLEPLRDESGATVGVAGIAVEVAGLSTADRALHQQQELADITLASIGDGVIRTDIEGFINYLNPVAEVLTGWSSAAALGRPVLEV